jgi:hypothetical protein
MRIIIYSEPNPEKCKLDESVFPVKVARPTTALHGAAWPSGCMAFVRSEGRDDALVTLGAGRWIVPKNIFLPIYAGFM